MQNWTWALTTANKDFELLWAELWPAVIFLWEPIFTWGPWSCINQLLDEVLFVYSNKLGFWPEMYDLLTNHLMWDMKAVWAGEEQNKPLISREMCSIAVVTAVQAQEMLPSLGRGTSDGATIPSQCCSSPSACLSWGWAPNLEGSALYLSFPCRFDVGVSKELCDLAAWQWGCLQGVPFVTSAWGSG